MKFAILFFVVTFYSCGSKEYYVSSYKIFKDSKAEPVIKALLKSDFSKADKLLTRDTSIINYQAPESNFTLVQWSVVNERYDIVKFLLAYKPNLDLPDYNNCTPLNYIASNPLDTDLFISLINSGADYNKLFIDKTGSESNAFLNVCVGSKKNLKFLLDKGLDPNMQFKSDEHTMITPLFQAICAGSYWNANLLIKYGAKYDGYLSYNDSTKYGVKILTLLRNSNLVINSENYRNKWELIDFLKSKGLDYSAEPIPERFKRDYLKEYLDKY